MPRKAPPLRRPLLDMKGAAAYTGFTRRQLKRWIEERTLPIPVVKVAGRNWFHQSDLDQLVDGFPTFTPVNSLVEVARMKAGRSVARAERKQRELMREAK
jgi:predicted DNA-binding transcriptional regulator AlpA